MLFFLQHSYALLSSFGRISLTLRLSPWNSAHSCVVSQTNESQKKNECHEILDRHFTLRNWPTYMAEPLVHLACWVISQTAKSICFLAVIMLKTR